MDESVVKHLEQLKSNETAQPSTADVLRRARALIAEPCRWRQYGGSCVMPEDQDAFCMMSALHKIAAGVAGMFDRCRGLLELATRSKPVYVWQDAPGRTHAEVLAAFDRAIALAEREGA